MKTCFDEQVTVDIAGMTFNGPNEVLGFVQRDVYGGKYKVEKIMKSSESDTIHCLFLPQKWLFPEPAIEYVFEYKNGKIISWTGRYR